MTQVTNYSTLSKEGVDVSVVYTVAASTTPETPAPPFIVGEETIGTSGSLYVFVQASTSVTYNDFVAITGANQAASLTSTNAIASGGVRIGVAPPATNASGGANGQLLAGTYFWAQIAGSGIAANTITTTSSNVQLFCTATAGVVSSVTVTLPALGGVTCTASTTVTGYQSNTDIMTFELSWPRLVTIVSSVVGTLSTANNP